MFQTVGENDRVSGPFILAAGQTRVPFDFPVYEAAQIRVQRVRGSATSTLTQGSGYTVEIGATGLGDIVLTAPALAGDQITILGDTSAARDSGFDPRGAFQASDVNRQFNRLHMLAQEAKRDVGRAIKAPVGATGDAPAPPPGVSVVFGITETNQLTWFATDTILGEDGMPIEVTAYNVGLLKVLHDPAAWREALDVPSRSEVIQVRNRGTYDANAFYGIGDLVVENSKLWMCLVADTQGVLPTGNPGVWLELFATTGGGGGGGGTGGFVGGPQPPLVADVTGGGFSQVQLKRSGAIEGSIGTLAVGTVTIGDGAGNIAFSTACGAAQPGHWRAIANAITPVLEPQLNADANVGGEIRSKGSGVLWFQGGQVGMLKTGAAKLTFTDAYTTRGSISSSASVAVSLNQPDYVASVRVPTEASVLGSLDLYGATASLPCRIDAVGSPASIGITLRAKAGGNVAMGSSSGALTLVCAGGAAPTHRWWEMYPAATLPVLTVGDAAATANLDINIKARGAGSTWLGEGQVQIGNAGVPQVYLANSYTVRGAIGADVNDALSIRSDNNSFAALVRVPNRTAPNAQIVLQAGVSGTPPTISSSSGSVTDVDLWFNGQGAGRVRVLTPLGVRSYTVATLPTTGNGVGDTAWASNGRNSGEGAGAGTGTLVSWSGAAWRIPGTTAAIAA